jgi:hypothetical protein
MSNFQSNNQGLKALRALVGRSYPDEKVRDEIWDYFLGYILTPDKLEIQDNHLKDITSFTDIGGSLAHIDIVVDAQDANVSKSDKLREVVFDKIWPRPWMSMCYGKAIGSKAELTRVFYLL